MKSVDISKVKVGDLIKQNENFYGIVTYIVGAYPRDVGITIERAIDGERQVNYILNNTNVNIEDDVQTIKEVKLKLEGFRKSVAFRNLRWIGGNLGSDPECFVVDKNNEMIPSFEFLKSKEEKDYTLSKEKNFKGNVCYALQPQTIFWDGFQAEFNVYSSDCLAWVIDSTFLGLKTLQQKARLKNKGAKLTLQSTFDIDYDVLKNAKNEHVAFGCMPSYNVYNMKGLVADGRDVPFRSAGGHIHFGISTFTNKGQNKEAIEKYVKALDKILGVACVSLFAEYDNPRRRTMYGLAGEYRLPPHGLEYRTLSNAWLSHPLIMNMVFELGRRAISAGHNDLMKYWDSTEEETIKCINECDVDLAREILVRNKEVFIGILHSHCHDMDKATNLYKIYMSGISSIIENPDNIEKNWGLDGMFEGHCEGEGMNINHIHDNKLYKTLKENTSVEIYEEMVTEIKEVETRITKKKKVG